jgi:hypothetical protein
VAIWHDPLEELIAGLERALPGRDVDRDPPLRVFCLATDVLLYGTPEEWRAFEIGPEGQRVAASFERIARQHREPLTK